MAVVDEAVDLRYGPRRHEETVEFATRVRVDRVTPRRLLEPLGYVRPAGYEARRHEQAKVA